MSEIRTLPVLPLRDIVVFPHMVVPLFVGRDKSVRALEEVMRGGKEILLVTQKNSADDDPAPADIYDVGVLATVLQLLKLPDGTVKVLVEGKGRAAVVRFTDQEAYYEAQVGEVNEDQGVGPEAEALSRAVVEQFENYVKLNKKVPPEALASIPQIAEPGKLADSISAHLSVKIGDKQHLLEIFDVVKRLEKVFALMEGEISVLQVEKKIRSRVKRQMEKTQREYYLNEQMKAIQRELGDPDDQRDELIELEKRIKKTKLSKEARAKAEGELKKLRNMSADHKRRLYTPNGILRATVLIDGFTAGRWRIEDGKTASVLHVDLFAKPTKAVATALADEGERLLVFAAKHAGGEVRIEVAET